MQTTFKNGKFLPTFMVSLTVITLALSISLLGCGTKKKAEAETTKIKVVELLSDKEAGDKLTAEDLGDEEVTDDPEHKQFTKEYIKEASEAEGKVARYKLSKGQQMMKDDLISVPEGSVVVKVAGEELSKLLKLKDEANANAKSKPKPKLELEKVAASLLEEEIEKAEVKETASEDSEASKTAETKDESKAKKAKAKDNSKKKK